MESWKIKINKNQRIAQKCNPFFVQFDEKSLAGRQWLRRPEFVK